MTQANTSGSPAGGAFPKKASDVMARAQIDLLNRVLPHSEQAEVSTLAAAMTNDPEAIAAIITLLKTAEDFYDARNKAIFEAILTLYNANKPIDITSVNEQLRVLNLWEQAGGITYLSEIAKSMISSAYGAHYASIVRNRAIQRRLIEACAQIIENSYPAADDLGKLLDESEQAIFMIAQRIDQQNLEPINITLEKLFENLSRISSGEVTGVPTGFTQLDQLTAGLQPSDLIIVAARPAMGKTAFALSLAVNAALQNTAVAIFSLEMSREQLVKRMLALRSHVSMSKLRRPKDLTDDDWYNLQNAANDLSSTKIFIDDTAYLSTLDLRARVRRLKSKHNIGLLIVDYLQLMHSPRGKDSRELEISDISRTLKAIAKDANIPVIALSQLNRKVEERGREDKRPQLSDLRESGAIEQDADIIMFIYRDDVYKFKKPADRPPNGEAEIIIGKQRNGPTGIAYLTYLSACTAFVNKAMDEQYPPSEVNM